MEQRRTKLGKERDEMIQERTGMQAKRNEMQEFCDEKNSKNNRIDKQNIIYQRTKTNQRIDKQRMNWFNTKFQKYCAQMKKKSQIQKVKTDIFARLLCSNYFNIFKEEEKEEKELEKEEDKDEEK
ncbi:hypothetical protein M0813_16750 [Anaeramoeba flamelloides]|uniref:Uncharacterized protein n=1 Tax=Anaeramoeba flamelloides TaxID=1746091 RepID=A0ABQ8YYL9_9EUKA|nr:hypothetical protein M0813_16750 [Anaeramoeba flamelloides]